MRDPLETRSGSRGAGVLGWTARLLVGGGAALLVWCALLLADASLSQRAARQSLEVALHSRPAISLREPGVTVHVPPPPPIVVRGSAIADLSIPRIQLSAVVLHGADERTLRRGPGHLEDTALPGEAGNVVIAGHRDSFFRPLRHARVGDDIFMDTPQGRVHYRVASLRVVDPHDLSVLESTDEATLTLITCYPFWVLGNAPDRFVVQAVRVDAPTEPAVAMPAADLPEPAARPAVPEPGPAELLAYARPVLDDETLVRGAIERFRLTYNARLVNHPDARRGGPLTFQTCAVTVSGDQAEATCWVSQSPPDDEEPNAWHMTLEREEPGWAIRRIEMT